MPSIPQIQIRQQFGRLGVEAEAAKITIRQPKADVDIHSEPAQVVTYYREGDLRIDQSRAWDALGIGNHLELMKRMYSSAKQVALEGIARIARNGDRMAEIDRPGNKIAEIAGEEWRLAPRLDVLGPASSDNVDIEYTPQKPDIRIRLGDVKIDVETHQPEVDYYPGSLHIYMAQYPKLEIIAPQIDLRI